MIFERGHGLLLENMRFVGNVIYSAVLGVVARVAQWQDDFLAFDGITS